jgi:hypothetical protein
VSALYAVCGANPQGNAYTETMLGNYRLPSAAADAAKRLVLEDGRYESATVHGPKGELLMSVKASPAFHALVATEDSEGEPS